MEKAYQRIAYFFVGIAVVIFIGFFKTYFGLFPHLNKVDGFHHFHAVGLILWLLLLIVQPILIRKRKYEQHRWLGRFTYVLVPVIVVTMLMAYKVQYERLASEVSHEENLFLLFFPLTDVLPFAIFYVLAIVNKDNIQKHMRYIIAGSLVLIGPGALRVMVNYFGVAILPAFNLTNLLTVMMFFLFWLYDFVRGGKSILKSPFALIFVVYTVPIVLSYFVPPTQAWQSAADTFVRNVF